jgi:hypothetical protein
MYIVPKGGNNIIWRWISYMKKLFPKKKLSKKEFVEFLDKKGFYVVLLLCILVIAATALFVTKYNIPSSNKDFDAERIIPEDFYDEFASEDENELASEAPIDVPIDVPTVANGVVTDVKDDPRWGITVVIEHDSGLKTVYSNLASDEMVVQNEKVAQGDIIGCVGNTAAFESAEQPHLHFEVWKDNEPVNPEDYLYK